MSRVIDVPGSADFESCHDELNEFRRDVLAGLNKPQKQIQSKYFYDEHGSELFNQITRHPDYYLTQCEIEILNNCKNRLARLLGSHPFNLVELGPGEGIKTQLLINEFLHESLNFNYLPIDISKKYLYMIINDFREKQPRLKLTPLHADYFRGLEWLRKNSQNRNLILFLGSSIGNFDPVITLEFLHHLCNSLNPGDYVFLGFDLRKNVDVLMSAYDDIDGITRDFNLNLLKRINRELNADFNIEKFGHYATYNVYTGAMESYLISMEPQIVTIEALEKSFSFDSIEPIHVEYSHKYLPSQIDQLAQETGFVIVDKFTDSRNYFMDTLWQVKEQK
jgi:dimethylhistidine N-methyltransferase